MYLTACVTVGVKGGLFVKCLGVYVCSMCVCAYVTVQVRLAHLKMFRDKGALAALVML